MSRPHENWLGDLSDEYIECRDLRHSWRLVDRTVYRVNSRTVTRVLVCPRCSARKTQLLVNNVVVSTGMNYHRAEGYLKPDDVQPGRVKRSKVLKESTARVTESTSMPEDVVAFLERRGVKVRGGTN